VKSIKKSCILITGKNGHRFVRVSWLFGSNVTKLLYTFIRHCFTSDLFCNLAAIKVEYGTHISPIFTLVLLS